MKNIAIFTMGTRGDVQPYIYLAQALNEAGQTAFIGTHPCWRDLVEAAGVAFIPIGPDIDIDAEAAAIRRRSKNPALSLLRTMQFIVRIVRESTSSIYSTCQGKDLIIASHSQMGATEAEALGIKKVHVTLQTEAIPEALKTKTAKDIVIGKLISSLMVRPYNKIRRVYGLPRLHSSDGVMGQDLNLIPISKWMKTPSPYWEKQHQMTGFWYRDDSAFSPPAELKQFLESGEKPVILALGAMAFEHEREDEKLNLFLTAFEKTGMRALIQGFQKSLQGVKLPAQILAIGSVPHSWLFQQGFCVIQHCGFGTTSASLIYGIPSIPVPHVLDQAGFARLLQELGVAVPPIDAAALSVDRMVDALNQMKATYTEKKQKVTDLSEKIRAESGLALAVKLINDVLET